MNLRRIIREELENDTESFDWIRNEMKPKYVNFNNLKLECGRYYTFYFHPRISVLEVKNTIIPPIESYFGPIKKNNFDDVNDDYMIDHLEIHDNPFFDTVLVGRINSNSKEELISYMHDSNCEENAIYNGREYFGV